MYTYMNCPYTPVFEKLSLSRVFEDHQNKVVHHFLERGCHTAESEGRLYTGSTQTNHHV